MTRHEGSKDAREKTPVKTPAKRAVAVVHKVVEENLEVARVVQAHTASTSATGGPARVRRLTVCSQEFTGRARGVIDPFTTQKGVLLKALEGEKKITTRFTRKGERRMPSILGG